MNKRLEFSQLHLQLKFAGQLKTKAHAVSKSIISTICDFETTKLNKSSMTIKVSRDGELATTKRLNASNITCSCKGARVEMHRTTLPKHADSQP